MCVVTISRGSFSGAQALAEAVARRLEVPCLSREILADAAQVAGVAEDALREALERPPSVLERASRERRDYLTFVQATLYREAANGSFVYHGHHGHLLLSKLSNVLRIRVVAPMAYRVDAVRSRHGLNERAALRHIKKVDASRAKWTRFLYGVEWDAPSLYDLVVNLEGFDAEVAAAGVVEIARSPRFAWTDALRQRALDQALACRVAGQLADSIDARDTELEIESERGVVVLRGAVRHDEVRQAIAKAAAQVPGVDDVRCEVTIPSDVFRE